MYFIRDYLTGIGTTAMPRCPIASTDRTPKITLSLETCSSARGVFDTMRRCHVAALSARQSTSYCVSAPAPGGVSHSRFVELSRSLVRTLTFVGGGGAEARVASVAAFTAATRATYWKSTNFGRSP